MTADQPPPDAVQIGPGSNVHGEGWRGYLSRGFLGPRDDRDEAVAAAAVPTSGPAVTIE